MPPTDAALPPSSQVVVGLLHGSLYALPADHMLLDGVLDAGADPQSLGMEGACQVGACARRRCPRRRQQGRRRGYGA